MPSNMAFCMACCIVEELWDWQTCGWTSPCWGTLALYIWCKLLYSTANHPLTIYDISIKNGGTCNLIGPIYNTVLLDEPSYMIYDIVIYDIYSVSNVK